MIRDSISGLSTLLLCLLLLLLISCRVEPVSSFSSQLEPFFGTYTGTAEAANSEVAERDLTVTIAPWENKGFTVNWTTIIYRADGKQKKSSPSINFYPSNRPGIFASAMKTNVFGHTVPYDPISEDANPYVWAGLENDTLTVSALYIVDGGSYDLQVYKRSVNDAGLALEFERFRDGQSITQIAAQLEPVGKEGTSD